MMKSLILLCLLSVFSSAYAQAIAMVTGSKGQEKVYIVFEQNSFSYMQTVIGQNPFAKTVGSLGTEANAWFLSPDVRIAMMEVQSAGGIIMINNDRAKTPAEKAGVNRDTFISFNNKNGKTVVVNVFGNSAKDLYNALNPKFSISGNEKKFTHPDKIEIYCQNTSKARCTISFVPQRSGSLPPGLSAGPSFGGSSPGFGGSSGSFSRPTPPANLDYAAKRYAASIMCRVHPHNSRPGGFSRNPGAASARASKNMVWEASFCSNLDGLIALVEGFPRGYGSGVDQRYSVYAMRFDSHVEEYKKKHTP